MKPAPRPRARVLLAGRFLVPRASLLALPDGPVAGLDLSSGELVALAFGPSADDARRARRAHRALERARAAAAHPRARTGISGARWCRSICVPPMGRALGRARRRRARGRCAALGAMLDAGGARASAAGPPISPLGVAGPCLRRPAIWPCDDPTRRSRRRLRDARGSAARRACPVAAPSRSGPPAGASRTRARRTLAPATPRARVVLVLACRRALRARRSRASRGRRTGRGVARCRSADAWSPRPACSRWPRPAAPSGRLHAPAAGAERTRRAGARAAVGARARGRRRPRRHPSRRCRGAGAASGRRGRRRAAGSQGCSWDREAS